jgi:hypothetical protein
MTRYTTPLILLALLTVGCSDMPTSPTLAGQTSTVTEALAKATPTLLVRPMNYSEQSGDDNPCRPTIHAEPKGWITTGGPDGLGGAWIDAFGQGGKFDLEIYWNAYGLGNGPWDPRDKVEGVTVDTGCTKTFLHTYFPGSFWRHNPATGSVYGFRIIHENGGQVHNVSTENYETYKILR